MDNSSDELELNICEAEEVGSPPSTGSGGGDAKLTHPSAAPSSPSAKRSRRSVQKRVVSFPISEVDGSRSKGGAGEGAPPSDSWTWRKYGQKPIKGSPYPRGYYRCSGSKGCPARKQVERSREDPSMIVVTYAFEHNHPWPLPKNHHKHPPAAKLVKDQSPPSPTTPSPPTQQLVTTEPSPPESTEREDKFSDLISDEESSLMIQAGSFQWFANAGSPTSNCHTAVGSDELLYGSVLFSSGGVTEAPGMGIAALLPEERGEETGGEGEDDALFAGLGELPEYSMVFRRGLASTTAASTW